MPNSHDILNILIHLLEEQEKVKVTYTIEDGVSKTTSTDNMTNAAS